MKAYQFKWVSAVLTLAAGTFLATAAEPSLKVGDPAPKLQQGKYVQGEPVKEFEPGKAYIVEFWATWCGPCRESIPHLNETYKKFKDKGLVVIGQDIWEEDDNLVAPFVKKMGDKMTYRVALDDKSGGGKGKMAETWMAAAGQDGIPTAFLIDTKGKIASIGHPMELKDQVIEQVLAGKYDTAKAAAESEELKKNEAKLQVVGAQLEKAMHEKKWDEAMAKLDEVEKLLPQEIRPNVNVLRFNVLLAKKDYTAAYKLAAKTSEEHKDNADLQHQLAWQIAADPSIEQRDLKLAATIAARANEAAKGKDPGIVDTQARILFMQGKKDEAIQMQEKALKLAQDEDQKKILQKTLDSYKKGELPKVAGE